MTYVSILKLWCLGNKCFWTADRRAAGDWSRPHQEASQACCSWSGTTVSHPGARNAHDEHCQSSVTVCQFGLHFWFHGLWTDRKKRKWVFFYCVQLFLINIKLFCLFFKLNSIDPHINLNLTLTIVDYLFVKASFHPSSSCSNTVAGGKAAERRWLAKCEADTTVGRSWEESGDDSERDQARTQLRVYFEQWRVLCQVHYVRLYRQQKLWRHRWVK